MSSQFRVGDVVMLKSAKIYPAGTPITMTVVGVEDGSVECEWHSTSGGPHKRKYPAEALELLTQR